MDEAAPLPDREAPRTEFSCIPECPALRHKNPNTSSEVLGAWEYFLIVKLAYLLEPLKPMNLEKIQPLQRIQENNLDPSVLGALAVTGTGLGSGIGRNRPLTEFVLARPKTAVVQRPTHRTPYMTHFARVEKTPIHRRIVHWGEVWAEKGVAQIMCITHKDCLRYFSALLK